MKKLKRISIMLSGLRTRNRKSIYHGTDEDIESYQTGFVVLSDSRVRRNIIRIRKEPRINQTVGMIQIERGADRKAASLLFCIRSAESFRVLHSGILIVNAAKKGGKYCRA